MFLSCTMLDRVKLLNRVWPLTVNPSQLKVHGGADLCLLIYQILTISALLYHMKISPMLRRPKIMLICTHSLREKVIPIKVLRDKFRVGGEASYLVVSQGIFLGFTGHADRVLK